MVNTLRLDTDLENCSFLNLHPVRGMRLVNLILVYIVESAAA